MAELDKEISAAYELWELLESIPKGRDDYEDSSYLVNEHYDDRYFDVSMQLRKRSTSFFKVPASWIYFLPQGR